MKNLFTLILVIGFSTSLFAQAPQLMNYQGVARDQNGNISANQLIGLQISIHQGTQNGTVVFAETHNPTTNATGLFSVQIGGGSLVSGDFSTIDWANGPFYTEIEMDPTGGSNYTVNGTEQLLSVPYALHSETSSSLISGGGGAGYIVQQEIPIASSLNYNNPNPFFLMGATSDQTGSLAFISYATYATQSYSNWGLEIKRFEKDPLTGLYYGTGAVSAIPIVNVGEYVYCGMAYLNGFVYVTYVDGSTVKIKRFDAATLSETEMNIIGGTINAGSSYQGKAMYTDGTYLYVYNYSNVWTKLAVSGIDLIDNGAVVYSVGSYGSLGIGSDIYHVTSSQLYKTTPSGTLVSSSNNSIYGYNEYDLPAIPRKVGFWNIDSQRLYMVTGRNKITDGMYEFYLNLYPVSKP